MKRNDIKYTSKLFILILISLFVLNLPQNCYSQKYKVKKLFSIGEGLDVPEYEIFGQIIDMTCDQQGNLYLADRKESRIQKFDKNGNFLFSIGQKGQGPGEFLGFLDIALDKSGNLYIHDTGNTRLSKYSSDGKLLLSTNTKSPNRSRINFLPNGNLTIYDFNIRKYLLHVYDKNLEHKKLLIKNRQKFTVHHNFRSLHAVFKDIIYFFLRDELKINTYSTEGKLLCSIPVNISELNKLRNKNINLSKRIFSKPRNLGSEDLYIDSFNKYLVINVDVFEIENTLKLKQTILFRIDFNGNFVDKIEIDNKAFSLIAFYNNGFYIKNSDGYIEKYQYLNSD
jgi:hypothetical protein